MVSQTTVEVVVILVMLPSRVAVKHAPDVNLAERKHKGEIRDDGWTMGNEWMEDVWLVDWLIGCLDGSMECWMTERAKPGHDDEVTRSLVFLVIFATNLQHVAKLNGAG